MLVAHLLAPTSELSAKLAFGWVVFRVGPHPPGAATRIQGEGETLSTASLGVLVSLAYF